MNVDFCSHESVHLAGESATHPIEPRDDALAALLLLAEWIPRCFYVLRHALPKFADSRRLAAHSGASNCRF